jgi:hypothetical protein
MYRLYSSNQVPASASNPFGGVSVIDGIPDEGGYIRFSGKASRPLEGNGEHVAIIPYCSGNADQVVRMEVYRIELYGRGPYYIRTLALALDLTACAQVGLEGGPVTNTERFFDAAEYVDGDTQYEASGNSLDVPCSIRIPARGAEYLYIRFTDGATGTDVGGANAIFQRGWMV